MLDDILPSQMRAARSLIGWTREQLAEAAGATTRNLARIEAGETKPFPRTLAAIRTALEAAGVEFIPENGGGAGVRLRKGSAPHAPTTNAPRVRSGGPEDEDRAGPEAPED